MSRPSDIELLSDIEDANEVQVGNMKNPEAFKKLMEGARQARSYGAYQRGFYHSSGRQTPSLPKLKFLEGKD